MKRNFIIQHEKGINDVRASTLEFHDDMVFLNNESGEMVYAIPKSVLITIREQPDSEQLEQTVLAIRHILHELQSSGNRWDEQLVRSILKNKRLIYV